MVGNMQRNTQWENTVFCLDFTPPVYLQKAQLDGQSQSCGQGMNGQGKSIPFCHNMKFWIKTYADTCAT